MADLCCKKKNAEVAQLPDYRLYISNYGRERREIAGKAIHEPLICTAKQFARRYGHIFPNFGAWAHATGKKYNEVFLWCFTISPRYYSATKRVDIVPEVVCNL